MQFNELPGIAKLKKEKMIKEWNSQFLKLSRLNFRFIIENVGVFNGLLKIFEKAKFWNTSPIKKKKKVY